MKSRVYKGNLFTMSLVIVNVLFSLAIRPLSRYFKLGNYTAMFIANLVFLALPLTIYFILNRESPKDVLRIKALNGKDILLIILIAIFIQPLMNFLSGIMALIFPNNVANLLSQSNNVPIWVRLFVIAVMPAVLEEFCMRGVVLSNYKHLGVKKSAILTGFLFAILHMNIQMFLYTFIMGILFAYLVHITDSIFSSMLSHLIINGTQIIVAGNFAKKAAKSGQDISAATASMDGSIAMKLGFIVGGLIVAILSILIVKALMKKLAQNHGMDLKNMDRIVYKEDSIHGSDGVETMNGMDCSSYINKEGIISQEEISSSTEGKEKIVDLPFMIIIFVYIVINGITLYNLFK